LKQEDAVVINRKCGFDKHYEVMEENVGSTQKIVVFARVWISFTKAPMSSTDKHKQVNFQWVQYICKFTLMNCKDVSAQNPSRQNPGKLQQLTPG